MKADQSLNKGVGVPGAKDGGVLALVGLREGIGLRASTFTCEDSSELSFKSAVCVLEEDSGDLMSMRTKLELSSL